MVEQAGQMFKTVGDSQLLILSLIKNFIAEKVKPSWKKYQENSLNDEKEINQVRNVVSEEYKKIESLQKTEAEDFSKLKTFLMKHPYDDFVS